MKLMLIALLYITSASYVSSQSDSQCQPSALLVPLPQGAFSGQSGCSCNQSELRDLKETSDSIKELIANNPELCYAGIKNGRVPNSAMNASSAWSDEYRAFYGRLDRTGNQRGFWHAGRNQYPGSWIQVDFGSKTRIVGVVTQGRSVPKHLNQWVRSYKIAYGNSPSSLQAIQRNGQDVVFQGNVDRDSHVTNYFPEPITARYFRLLVLTWNRHVAMRIEYLRC